MLVADWARLRLALQMVLWQVNLLHGQQHLLILLRLLLLFLLFLLLFTLHPLLKSDTSPIALFARTSRLLVEVLLHLILLLVLRVEGIEALARRIDLLCNVGSIFATIPRHGSCDRNQFCRHVGWETKPKTLNSHCLWMQALQET